jgi:glycosyltransferase involved in cell wall biosynthesis
VSASETFPLSVVVPAYNEEASLAETVRGLRTALDALGLRAEIVIVNDGSLDATGLIADALAEEDAALVVCHQPNQGLGGALRTGIGVVRGEYVLTWPADMPVERADLAPFAAQLGAADVLVGVRSRRAGYNLLMRFNSWLYPQLVALLFDLRLRDVNWIHLYRTALIRRVNLSQRGIPMLVEALVRLRDLHATFLEVPSEMKPRTAGTASASRFLIMWRTLRGLLAFHRQWNRARRASGARRPASSSA